MFNVKGDPLRVLKELGLRLKKYRLQRNESQEVFSSRLGLSRQTYSKMEQGHASIAIGHWLTACHLLGKLDSWRGVLAEDANLFEQFEKQSTVRQRAGRVRRGGK